jgi:CubicO group peptidase (beta-lactamase class C family)
MFNRTSFIMAAMLWAGLYGAPWAALAQTPDASAVELERVALEELKDTGTPGVAVAVVKGDRVIYSKGLGISNLETGAPVTSGMLFRAGTITKIFTAATLVALAEEGRLKLDEPIGKYLKGLGPKLSQVTAHQLLSHTAGLREEHQQYGIHDDSMLGQVVRSWKDDYCLIEPGVIYSHSNPGYILAGLLIQEVSGKPFADVLNERWFKPLGMDRTTFRITQVMTSPFTQSYRAFGDEKLKQVVPYALDAVGLPSGSMFSSADDLARFARAFVNDGKLDGKQLISPSLIGKLSNPYVSVPGVNEEQKGGYALTMDTYRGVRVLRNSGSWGGFTTLIWLVPEHRFAVILMANRNAAFFNTTAQKALELMLPLQPAKSIGPRINMPMNEAEMNAYAGTYFNEDTVEILTKDGKLWLKERNALLPVTKHGAGHFSAGEPGSDSSQDFTLVKGPGGKIEYLHRAGRALKKITPPTNAKVDQ